MKRLLLITLIISFFSIQSYSQKSEDNKLFFFGAGIGVGFFSPSDVNDMLAARYSSYQLEYGSFNMIMYFVLNAKGSFFFSRYTELQLEAEWAFSPKIVSAEGTDIYFYRRITPSLKFNFHIPTSDKFSIFFGPGISWNSLKFNTPDGTDLKGNTIGFSIQTGVMVRFRKWAIAPFITTNFINAKDADAVGDYEGSTNINLNYTGVQIGNTFFF